jgi:peptidoglycan biosynthesis protein MviN/MurJ (putative lipid II flippase)
VHAIPRISAAVLAERRAAARDAVGGSWRVYTCAVIGTLTGLISVALFTRVLAPSRGTQHLLLTDDVAWTSATLATAIACACALVFEHRSEQASALSSMLAVYAWMILFIALPVALLLIAMARFGVTA